MRLIAVGLACILGACGGNDSSSSSCIVGDAKRPPEIETNFVNLDTAVIAAANGARVPLVTPPVGGKVLLVQLRVRNLDTCSLSLSMAARDTNGTVVGQGERPLTAFAGDDGWAHPPSPGIFGTAIRADGVLFLCPNAKSTRDIHEQPYDVTVSVKDGAMREATQTVTVTPFCQEGTDRPSCECECRAGYMPGPCPT